MAKAAKDTVTVVVRPNNRLKHDNVGYEAGTTVNLPPDAAKKLIADGVVEAFVAPAPEEKVAEG